jgi:hypothetical protein
VALIGRLIAVDTYGLYLPYPLTYLSFPFQVQRLLSYVLTPATAIITFDFVPVTYLQVNVSPAGYCGTWLSARLTVTPDVAFAQVSPQTAVQLEDNAAAMVLPLSLVSIQHPFHLYSARTTIVNELGGLL